MDGLENRVEPAMTSCGGVGPLAGQDLAGNDVAPCEEKKPQVRELSRGNGDVHYGEQHGVIEVVETREHETESETESKKDTSWRNEHGHQRSGRLCASSPSSDCERRESPRDIPVYRAIIENSNEHPLSSHLPAANTRSAEVVVISDETVSESSDDVIEMIDLTDSPKPRSRSDAATTASKGNTPHNFRQEMRDNVESQNQSHIPPIEIATAGRSTSPFRNRAASKAGGLACDFVRHRPPHSRCSAFREGGSLVIRASGNSNDDDDTATIDIELD